MNILVLGAGVIGVSTAYALARKGCKVTIVDQANSVASGASFANGGQLSYSFVDPMASPAFFSKLPSIFLGKDPSIKMKLVPGQGVFKWGALFAKECLNGQKRHRLTEAVKLAQESEAELSSLMTDHPISFRYQKVGKLVVTRHKSQLAALAQSANIKRGLGMDVQLLDKAACFDACEQLQHNMADICGGLLAPNDAVGDARRFTEALALYISEKFNVTIKLKRRIQKLLTDGERTVGVRTDREDYAADAVVVCMGAAAPKLLRPYGIKLPIIPVKGYSLSMPGRPGTSAVSLTDLDHKIVFAKLDNEVRIAGLSDFGEGNSEIQPERAAFLEKTARHLMPNFADYEHIGKPWAGLRPMTPDGLPITGPSALKNLFLNTGHGMLGWTFALGSAERLAKCLVGSKQQITGMAA